MVVVADRRVLDPRWLELPTQVLVEVGIDLAPYGRRHLSGGCPLCRAESVLVPPGLGRREWGRCVYHESHCPMPRTGGLNPQAYLN